MATSPSRATNATGAALNGVRPQHKEARMSHTESGPTHPGAAGAVDTLDRALRDASTPTSTRRWLLEHAAMGAAGVAAASAVIPGGQALARSHHDSINEWGV